PPLGPSISAGLAPSSAALPNTKRCKATSGTAMSGYGLRKIIDWLAAGRDAQARLTVPRVRCQPGCAAFNERLHPSYYKSPTLNWYSTMSAMTPNPRNRFYTALTLLVSLARLAGGQSPPVARVVPKIDTLHGEIREDDYFW